MVCVWYQVYLYVTKDEVQFFYKTYFVIEMKEISVNQEQAVIIPNQKQLVYQQTPQPADN